MVQTEKPFILKGSGTEAEHQGQMNMSLMGTNGGTLFDAPELDRVDLS